MAYTRSEKAILKTIIYSDIFDFPVLESELWRFLITEKKIKKEDFIIALNKLSTTIKHKEEMYCLPGKEEIIDRRKSNSSEASKKIRLAKHAAYVLSHIPSIYFIGLSGGTAVGNVQENDDVDLFIITKKNTLFVTRVFILVILEALGLRRKRNDQNPADKICANLLVDEEALVWSLKLRDLYTAREIVQMKPLFERNGMYRKFLMANEWITNCVPNAEPYRVAFTEPKRYVTIGILSAVLTMFPFELLMRIWQKAWMERHRTRESISNHVLAFHPHDYRKKTMKMFEKRLKEYGINNN